MLPLIIASSPVRVGSPPKLSDYRRTFRAVQMRSNVRWAPITTWPDLKREEAEVDVDNWTSQGMSHPFERLPKLMVDFLQDHLRRHTDEIRRRRKPPHGLKSAPLDKSVADVWARYQEAADPRKVLDELQDQQRFPWKTLAFDQQPRPPYRGTWTKSSVTVGARTPFAQDPVLDYSYDSGDEWQDDEGGEDVDDFGENVEAEDEDEEDDEEGEFDDWLDDSEDAGYGPSTMDVDEDMPLPLTPGGSVEQPKAPLKVVKKSVAPRKVVKLTPTWKGPLWEEKFGDGNEGMENYRIQLLNGMPTPP